MFAELKDSRRDRLLHALPRVLPQYLMSQRWFGAKARTIQSVDVLDAVPAGGAEAPGYVIFVRARLADGDPHTYALPLVALTPDRAAALNAGEPAKLMIAVPSSSADNAEEKWCDALWDPAWPRFLLRAVGEGRTFPGSAGELQGVPTRAFARLCGDANADLTPSVMRAEQSNTSVRFGDRLIFKLFRRVQSGVNPDVEICTALTERTSFAHFAAVAGSLVWRQGEEESSLGILQAYVPNRGDAWTYTLDSLAAYFDRRANPPHQAEGPAAPRFPRPADSSLPPTEAELDGYGPSARLLGQRTAQLHRALASVADDPAFSPEPFSPAYQRSLHEFMADLSGGVFGLLRQRLGQFDAGLRELAGNALQREGEVAARFRSVLDRPIDTMRIRIHGDYHLGQVLYTGDDFVIIDFEGEPARSVNDRRIKRSPLRDVAGMLRSFHYAAYAASLQRSGKAGGAIEREALESWARRWQACASAAFLQAYLSTARGSAFLPRAKRDLEMLLQVYLLEKAVYELGYELNNRPDWVRIPLEGINDALNRLN